jgi:hypothetical protein
MKSLAEYLKHNSSLRHLDLGVSTNTIFSHHTNHNDDDDDD